MDIFKMPHVTWEFVLINDEDAKKLSDKKFIKEFMLELAKETGLTPLQEIIYQFECEKDTNRNGITAFLTLAESSIDLHTWPECRYGFVDIFACKDFDANKAGKLIKIKLGPGLYRRDTVRRGKIVKEFITKFAEKCSYAAHAAEEIMENIKKYYAKEKKEREDIEEIIKWYNVKGKDKEKDILLDNLALKNALRRKEQITCCTPKAKNNLS